MIEEHLTVAGEPLAELAHRLAGARTGRWSEDGTGRWSEDGTGRWSEDGTRALVHELGLHWEHVTDPASAGGPRLRPVGPSERRHVDEEAYLELAVTVASAGPDAAGQVRAFGRARSELTAALGEASVIGSYGLLGPYYGSTAAWGSPFLRWRGERDTLELRAGRQGPELVLEPTAPLENWYCSLGHGEEGAIGGFLGRRSGPSTAGLSLPGRWSARSWETLTASLATFFATLPAEFAALGIAKIMRLYGRVGGTAPRLFDIDADSRLMLASFADSDLGPESFGWGTVAEHPRTTETWADPYDPGWRFDGGGPGVPAGRALAEMVVATARAQGVASVDDLLLGGEAEDIGPYRVTFYGRGLTTV
ncbi:hypothetical protein [Kitasatospora sp. NPDC050463]|uniref:hypothetical protein n=1 Tax=Kitasatospora sp. NPDC050463 TaxID=3155786 RepID=UPI0033DD70BE